LVRGNWRGAKRLVNWPILLYPPKKSILGEKKKKRFITNRKREVNCISYALSYVYRYIQYTRPSISIFIKPKKSNLEKNRTRWLYQISNVSFVPSQLYFDINSEGRNFKRLSLDLTQSTSSSRCLYIQSSLYLHSQLHIDIRSVYTTINIDGIKIYLFIIIMKAGVLDSGGLCRSFNNKTTELI
jgi:hypothetical protein